MTKRLLRPISVGVILLIAGLTIASTVALRRSVAADEKKLLNERGAEVTALLQSVFQQEIASARVLGQVALAADATDVQRTFAAGAQSLEGQGVSSFGIAAATAHGYVVRAAVGDGLRPGMAIAGQDAQLLRQAQSSVDGATSIVTRGSTSRIGLELPIGHNIVFLYTNLTPRTPIPPVIGPFRSLRGAVYASPTPQAATLVMTTDSRLPLVGSPTGQSTFFVGDSKWSLVYATKGPLVDGWSARLPWLVLGAGLGLAVLVAALIEILSRRQSYARHLVEERTRSLTEANAELKQAEETADRANRSKSEFLSRMSHELRTPLNAILGYAQILQMDLLRDDQEQPVEQILSSGRHLLELINEVLDISRIEVGRLSLSIEPVGLAEVMETALDMVRPAAREQAISLITGPGFAGTTVLADRQRLRQILLNLLTNAVKYNEHGGSVTVSCDTVEGRAALISVSDTGPGISPENHELVFAPFERLACNPTHVEGSGIGLALARHLAEAMGGTIGLQSELGEGSTFWVELPLAHAPADESGTDHDGIEVPAQRTGSTSQTVLLVEDNPANIGLVERVLSRLGDVRVVSATSGRAAIEIARSAPPSLVLLDVHLPDLGGEQVLRALRDDPRTATVPVIVVSADATAGQIERLLGAGATAYLTKPIEIQQLLDVVASATTTIAS